MADISEILNKARVRCGAWVFSIAAIVLIPMIPLLVEAQKNHGSIRDESYYMTAAVLAASFGFTSEGNVFRTGYLLCFIWAIVADFKPEQANAASAVIENSSGFYGFLTSHTALAVVLLTALIHIIERFIWHVVSERRFPDYLEKN